MKKLLALVLAVLMVVSLFAACGPKETTPSTQGSQQGSVSTNGTPVALPTYTYNSYSSSLGTCWNPHTWETNADSSIMGYLEAPLTDITILNSEEGSYQWIFVAATDIKDVTAENVADLEKYGCAETDATEGYVYEIKLRPEMKWQDGTPINADTYIYSMKALLDPAMKNYRAGNYISGDSALAGAFDYYNQGAPIYAPVVPPYEDTPDYSLDTSAYDLYINLTSMEMTITGYSFYELCYDYGYVSTELYNSFNSTTNIYGYTKVTDDNKETLLQMMDQYLAAFGVSIYNEDGSVNEEFYKEFLFYDTKETSPAVSFDAVGLYKVDDYTIRYVCESAYDYYYFLTSCTSNWLVYEDLYEAGKKTTGELTTTDYATSMETTMSYGAFKMTSLQDGKQIVFEQNENYWEFTKNADGTLSSTTFFQVDGEYVEQYMTQKIVIDVMTDDAAKLAFLAGELDDWAPPASEVPQYSTSDQLYQVDETYTMRLFFNDNLASLQAMDEAGNQNSVVMSNINFRKAMSLAIDRADWVTATAGYKPAYYLLNSLYFYDVYEDPASIYRNTDEAMQAICDLYGVEYGEGTPYKDLKAAYKSITGYNLTEAKNLFTTACNELVDAGLYTKGEPIVIRMGWAKGSLDASAQQQIELLNKYLNEALKDTGFGTIELQGIDNINDRYGDVVNGTYAIGYGAWGGAAFYPFNAIGCYTDAEYAGTIHESGSWNPAAVDLTITINGEEKTMSYEAWTQSLRGTGEYATAEASIKLTILAELEQGVLEQYHCIPLATSATASMLSYKLSYYTEVYSIMYGFGGTRLLRYNYSDAEWAEFVESEGGNLSYT